jgi:ankyrin repeat protein
LSFIEIAKSGNTQEWEKFLSEGNNPNELDQYGTTPLTWVVKMDKLDLFAFAIQHGSDPFYPYRTGGSVFFDLLSQNKTIFLENLLNLKEIWKNSEHLLTKNKDGNTIFHEALNHSDEELWMGLRDLLQPGDWEIRNEEGRTIFLEAVATGNIGFVSDILDEHPEFIYQVDKDGKNALHIAAERNISEDVEYLLGIGFSVDQKDNLGNTALFLAASGDSVESMEILLAAGADLLVYGENKESITRMMDREKYSFSMKLWKKELYRRLKEIDFSKDKGELNRYLEYLRKEKPLVDAEIAQAKLLDYL